MTNLQLLLSIGVPTFFVLAGILLNHKEAASVRTDMNRQFDEVKRQFDEVRRQFDKVDSRLLRIEEDQKQFFKTTGVLDGRMDELSARVK